MSSPSHPEKKSDEESDISSEKSKDVPIEAGLKNTKDAVEGVLDPIAARRERIAARRERKLQELSAKREAKELSPHDFDLNYIYQLNEAGLPLTRKDMVHETGNQALVLTFRDFRRLGLLDFIHSSGERMVIEATSLHPNDVLILYPDEVGDLEQ